ncbi:MAG: hypothetical protein WB930_13855 [Syntrophobacteraceae bacterium]
MRRGPERERFVEDLIQDGRILATQRAQVIAMLNWCDLQADHLILLPDARRMSPLAICEELLRTKPPMSVQEQFAALAEAKERKDGISYAEAFRLVQIDHPELARAYYPTIRTHSEGSPIARLNALAEAKAAREDISFSEAYRRVQLENPGLARDCVAFYVS